MAIPRSLRTSAAALVLLVAAACSEGGSGTTVTAATTGAKEEASVTRTSLEPELTPPSLAGDVAVTGPVEAFCSGLVSQLIELGEDAAAPGLETLTPEECVQEFELDRDLAADIGLIDVSLEAAFARGCAIPLAQVSADIAAGVLSEEEQLDVALTICYGAFDPELWRPNDYMIVADGVCYLGMSEESAFRGCRNSFGDLIQEVEPNYAGDEGRVTAFLEQLSRVAGRDNRFAADRAYAAELGQETCEDLEWSRGSYDLLRATVDLQRNGRGRGDMKADEYSEYVAFRGALPEAAATHLCPQFLADVDSSRRFWEEEGFEPTDSSLSGQLAQVFFEIEDAGPAWAENKAIYQEMGREHWFSLGLEVCQGLDSGLTFEAADAQVRAPFAGSSNEEEEHADQLFTAQILAAIAYEVCPRHYDDYAAWQYPDLD